MKQIGRVILAALLCAESLSACTVLPIPGATGDSAEVTEMFGEKKYRVDYHGRKSAFEGARDAYKAGEQVTLYYGFIATDTDYSFYVDGGRFNAPYTDKGYEISFVMPAHDVDVRVQSRNSMVYQPPSTRSEAAETELLLDYYHAVVGMETGSRSQELVLSRVKGERELLLEVIDKTNGTEETGRYRVPSFAEEGGFAAVQENELPSLVGKEGDPIDGAVTVVKFRNSDGTYSRVSTDNVKDGGEQALDSVAAALRRFVREEYRIVE